MSLGAGYRYLMDSVARGDAELSAATPLTRYYAESGTPAGRFLGAGLSGLNRGAGVVEGSEVTAPMLFNMLGMIADPVTGKPLGRTPARWPRSFAQRVAERVGMLAAGLSAGERAVEIEAIQVEEAARERRVRRPVAGFDLTFSVPKSVSAVWALADAETQAVIYRAHRDAARFALGYAERTMIFSRSGRNAAPVLSASAVDPVGLRDSAVGCLAAVSNRRATFTRANVLAEDHRHLHGVRFTTPQDCIAVAERVTDLALEHAVLVSAPDLHHVPQSLRRTDGSSPLRPKGSERYTTRELLDAESRLLDAGRDQTGPAIRLDKARDPQDTAGHELGADQRAAVRAIATSGRVLDVLVGAAGTGKTTTLGALRARWEAVHGPGSVTGLAPSAVAADVLGAELGIGTENIAKWLTEADRQDVRRSQIAELRARLARFGSPGSVLARRASRRIAGLERDLRRWSVQPRQLVIIDEASLAATLDLDRLVHQTQAAGGKLLLVGDWAQLSAVRAGGAFSMLVRDRDHVPELCTVRRFSSRWEKTASIALREGDPAVIDTYDTHHRINSGDREQMLDAVFTGWRRDSRGGLVSLMIAGDRSSVAELNQRARSARVAAGEIDDSGVQVAEGGIAGIGDTVITRRNDRTLSTGTGWVKNGGTWTVRAIAADGSMTVHRPAGGGQTVLAADYARAHVELGYATTAYRAQGRTVDTAHALISSTSTREGLYVSATRGRHTNTIYVDTTIDGDAETSHGPDQRHSAGDVLRAVLGNTAADESAHTTIERELTEAESTQRITDEYQVIASRARSNGVDYDTSRALRERSRAISADETERRQRANTPRPSTAPREPISAHDVGHAAGVPW